jgi:hypothetical protein
MPTRFRCPHCKATLNPGTKIVLRISRGKKSAVVLLSPKLGDYTVILPDDFIIRRGDKATFSCPACAADLTSASNSNFAEVLRQRADGEVDRVQFHRNFGEQATFVISKGEIKAFGADAADYSGVNFFGAGRE